MTTPTKVERSYPRDLEAEIRFLATSENGRNGPARTGYRCQFRYDGQDWFGLFTFPETGTAEPGETVRAYVSFSAQRSSDRRYMSGSNLKCERARVVANGTVTRIIELATRMNEPLKPSFTYPD